MGRDALTDLLDRYLATGEEAAMEKFVRATRPQLLTIARRIGARDEAEDCVQAAYLSLVRRFREGVRAAPLPWLITAVVRIAYRKRALERRRTDLAARLERPGDAPSASAGAAAAEEREQVRIQIARLPARYRDVVSLHYLEGLTTPEIAELLEIPDATARTRLRRGRELLRGPLAPYGRGLLFAVPWLVQDAAGHTLLLGETVMRKKLLLTSIVVAFLAGLTAVSFNLRSDGAKPDRASTRAEKRAAAAIGGPAEDRRDAEPRADSFVTGTVLAAGGEPVPGARIRREAPSTFFRGFTPPAQPSDTLASLFAPNEPAGEFVTTSDAEGRFRLPVEADAMLALYVTAAAHSPAHAQPVRAGDDVTVTLGRAPSLQGRVFDLEQNPVPGAELAWWTSIDGRCITCRATAAEDGAYRIEGLPSPRGWTMETQPCRIAVRADGFAPVVTTAPELHAGVGDTMTMDLFLARAATLQVQVVDGDSLQPIAGARVSLRGIEWGPVEFDSGASDAGGNLTMTSFPVDGFHLPPSVRVGDGLTGVVTAVVRAEVEGYAAGTLNVPPVRPGDTQRVSLHLWPTATVRGRVVDGEGRPVEGATVSGFRNLTPKPSHLDLADARPWSRTGADGAFVWTSVPARRGEADVLHLGVHRAGWTGPSFQIDVRAGETTTVPDIVIGGPPRPSVILEVVDPAGNPVAGAVPNGSASHRTDADGRCRFFCSPDEQRFSARSRDSGDCLSEPVVPSVDDPPIVRIVLDAVHVLQGDVRWADGAPAVGARIRVSSDRGTLGTTRSGTDGSFRVGRLPDQPIDVVAELEATSTRATGVRARDGCALELPTSSNRPGGVIEGRVTGGPAKRPLLRFTAQLRGETRARALPDRPGHFRFEDVPLGTWRLLVFADGHATAEREVVVRAADEPVKVDVNLIAGATVHGSIRNRTGRRLALNRIQFLDERGECTHERARIPFRSSDAYRLNHLPPGRYDVLVHGDGKLAVVSDGPLVVREGDVDVRFDFEVHEGGLLVVKNADTAKRIEIANADGRVVWRRIAPGEVVGGPFAPGRYTLHADGAQHSLEVTAKSVTELDLAR